jgi:hypothetical protein
MITLNDGHVVNATRSPRLSTDFGGFALPKVGLMFRCQYNNPIRDDTLTLAAFGCWTQMVGMPIG